MSMVYCFSHRDRGDKVLSMEVQKVTHSMDVTPPDVCSAVSHGLPHPTADLSLALPVVFKALIFLSHSEPSCIHMNWSSHLSYSDSRSCGSLCFKSFSPV